MEIVESFVVARIAELVALCWFYRIPVLFMNLAISITVFVVMIWLYREWLREEDWVTYFAGAFGLFSIVYSLRLANALWHPVATADVDHLKAIESWASVLVSPCINALFALAALSLGRFRDWTSRWGVRVWLLSITAIPAAIEAFAPASPIDRYADAIISAVILFWLGGALFVNISVRRRPVFAILALVFASLYALVNILYALNPILANGWWPALMPQVSTDLKRFAEFRSATISASTPLTALDSFVFAFAAFPKLGLFGGAVVLALRTLVVVRPRELRPILHKIVDGRVELLTDHGVLPAVGLSFEADLVAICYLLPGRPGEVAWWRWVKPPTRPGRPGGLEICKLPGVDKSVVSRVISDGLTRTTGDRVKEYSEGYMGYIEGLHSFVVVPIRYHGAIIGALNIEWEARKAFTPAAVPRIQLLADCLAPAVHAKRQLVALDEMTGQLSQLDLKDPTNREQSLRAISECLHRILTPLGTATLMEPGFSERIGAICIGADGRTDVFKGDEVAMRAELEERLAGHPSPIEVLSNPVAIAGVTIGHLAFAVARDRDRSDRPTLVDDQLHRRNVAALVGDAMLDGRRRRYAGVINALDIDLSLPIPHSRAWLEVVSRGARNAGLVWVAAQLQGDHEDEWLGEPGHIQVAQAASERRSFQTDTPTVGEPVPPGTDAATPPFILRLRLADAKAFLWIGVERPALEAELRPQWPWREFLNNLAASADSALSRLRVQGLQFRAHQDYALVMTSVATGAFVHELVKATARVALTVENTQRLAVGSASHDVIERLALVSDSIQALRDHTERLVNVEKFDEARPCQLANAVGNAAKLFLPILSERRIILECKIPAGVSIDVPLSIAYLAVANLISNSIDAFGTIGLGRLILVTTHETDDDVFCDVSDDGPGISPAVVGRLFEVNASTRAGGHGIGLYLTKRSLNDHGCSVRLKASSPGGTVFEIKFPKPHRRKAALK